MQRLLDLLTFNLRDKEIILFLILLITSILSPSAKLYACNAQNKLESSLSSAEKISTSCVSSTVLLSEFSARDDEVALEAIQRVTKTRLFKRDEQVNAIQEIVRIYYTRRAGVVKKNEK